MICMYLRSSAIGSFKSCQMRYALEYNLSIPSTENKKAALGTICHKVYELLALRKFCSQTGQELIDDDLLGIIYPDECEVIPLLDRVFEKESAKGVHKFTKKDKENVLSWIEYVLNYGNGQYNPVNMQILSPESIFDVEICKPWAYYSFDLAGSHYEGYARVKGTSDLIYHTGVDGVYGCWDLKTGVRCDWTKKDTPVKTAEYLQNDQQMMLYYWAMRQKYPEAKDILMTLFYARDSEVGGFRGDPKQFLKGGPMHIIFSDDDLPRIEEMLKDVFENIINTEIPKLTSDWRCSSLCFFGQTPSAQDPSKTICDFMHGEMKKKGFIRVVEEYGDLNKLGHYLSGGGRSYKEGKNE